MSRYIPLGRTRKEISNLGDRIVTRFKLNLTKDRFSTVIEEIVIDTPAVSPPDATPSERHRNH
jgi:hypothetical protein